MRSAALCSLLAHAARAQDPAYLWEQTIKPGDTVFAGRNGHASAVFLDKLWVIGGHVSSCENGTTHRRD